MQSVITLVMKTCWRQPFTARVDAFYYYLGCTNPLALNGACLYGDPKKQPLVERQSVTMQHAYYRLRRRAIGTEAIA